MAFPRLFYAVAEQFKRIENLFNPSTEERTSYQTSRTGDYVLLSGFPSEFLPVPNVSLSHAVMTPLLDETKDAEKSPFDCTRQSPPIDIPPAKFKRAKSAPMPVPMKIDRHLWTREAERRNVENKEITPVAPVSQNLLSPELSNASTASHVARNSAARKTPAPSRAIVVNFQNSAAGHNTNHKTQPIPIPGTHLTKRFAEAKFSGSPLGIEELFVVTPIESRISNTPNPATQLHPSACPVMDFLDDCFDFSLLEQPIEHEKPKPPRKKIPQHFHFSDEHIRRSNTRAAMSQIERIATLNTHVNKSIVNYHAIRHGHAIADALAKLDEVGIAVQQNFNALFKYSHILKRVLVAVANTSSINLEIFNLMHALNESDYASAFYRLNLDMVSQENFDKLFKHEPREIKEIMAQIMAVSHLDREVLEEIINWKETFAKIVAAKVIPQTLFGKGDEAQILPPPLQPIIEGYLSYECLTPVGFSSRSKTVRGR